MAEVELQSARKGSGRADRSQARWPGLAGATDTLERGLRLLDGAIRIPGTNFRVGLDPILGLLAPSVGDVIGGVMSLSVLVLGVQYRLPLRALFAMVLNILLDSTLGAVPVVGDAFDLVWKSNDRNLRLLQQHRARSKPTLRGGRRPFYWLGVVGILVFALACLAVPFVLVAWLVHGLLGS